MKQNVVFLDKMFHIKGARWRLVPYVILEGHSPDRIQSIKKRTAAMRTFLRYIVKNVARIKTANCLRLHQER